MAGQTKVLTFSEGIVVEAASQSFLQASALETYVDDTAFETAKGGVGTEGDIYGNTTLNLVRYHDGTIWRSILNTPHKWDATTAPTVGDDSDDGWKIGSFWIDEVAQVTYIALDVTVGAAVWMETGKPIIGIREIPTGLVNGINADYTMTYTPVDNTLIVFRDGNAVPLDQFTYAHPVITMGTAPVLGQKIEVAYLTNGSTATVQADASNQVVVNHTVTSGEITAKQLTLPSTPSVPTRVIADVRGGTIQIYGLDFIVSGTTFDWNGYALDGIIIAGEIIRIVYYV